MASRSTATICGLTGEIGVCALGFVLVNNCDKVSLSSNSVSPKPATANTLLALKFSKEDTNFLVCSGEGVEVEESGDDRVAERFLVEPTRNTRDMGSSPSLSSPAAGDMAKVPVIKVLWA